MIGNFETILLLESFLLENIVQYRGKTVAGACDLALGAFVLLLRLLVRVIGIYFLFYCNEFRGKSRCEPSIKLRRQKNYSLLITLYSLKKTFVFRLSSLDFLLSL